MWIFTSNLPGLRRAWSIKFILFVAPTTKILLFWVNPSISVSNWLIVDLFYLLWKIYPLEPIASISSMKITHPSGIERAVLKISLILLGPTPTKTSWNSEAEALRKASPASLANILANIVFPVPGGPWKSIPLLILNPFLIYF